MAESKEFATLEAKEAFCRLRIAHPIGEREESFPVDLFEKGRVTVGALVRAARYCFPDLHIRTVDDLLRAAEASQNKEQGRGRG